MSVLRFWGKREFRVEREYSHAQPLVSKLPDGFSGECEPLSKTLCVLGGEMSGWVTKTKKDTHLSVLRFGDPSGNRTRVSSVRG